MKRMRRHLFNFIAAVSVLCLVGVVGMWIRSYFFWDRIGINDPSGIGLKSIIHSDSGRVDVIVFVYEPRSGNRSSREFRSVPSSSHPTDEEKDRLQEWMVEKSWLAIPDALPWGFSIRVDVPNSPHLTQHNLSIRYGMLALLMPLPALLCWISNRHRAHLLNLEMNSGEQSDKPPAEAA